MLEAHIQLDKSVNAKYAIMPGDPARIDRIIPFLEDVKVLAYNREFRSISGYYKGVKVIAISTGIGGSSASIAIEELKHIGVDTMIRIGSCGALQKNIQLGDLIFAVGAVVADTEFLLKCIETAKENHWNYHTGIVHSHESFYIDTNAEEEKKWSAMGVLGADMETAALFTVGRLRNIRTMSILNNVVLYGQDTADAIGNYADQAAKTMEGERREILTALEAIYKLEKNV